jgi:hypothetical protein
MSIVDLATFLSAGAASLAVILGAVNLYFTDRREHLGWARSVLEAAFVDFLTASYDHRDICRELARLQQGIDSGRSEEACRELTHQAHTVMMNCITRFRVLVSDEMAEAAIRLHEHNDMDMEMIDAGDGAAFLSDRERRRLVFNTDRDVFIKMAQKRLRVRRVGL